MTKRTGIGRVTIPSQNSQQGIEWNTQYQREKEKALVLIETYYDLLQCPNENLHYNLHTETCIDILRSSFVFRSLTFRTVTLRQEAKIPFKT